MIDEDVCLKAVVGSTAYGLNTEDSDIDMLGIWVEPTENMLGLKIPKETFVSNRPDITLHELGKFCRLAIKGNPTVIELLFLDEYVVQDDVGRLLVSERKSFLGQDKIREAYIGYAYSQIERLKKRGDFGSDLKKRYAKHARHTFRLLLQAEQLLSTGDMNVRVSKDQRDYLFSLGETSINELSDLFKNKVEYLDNLDSDLPKLPDFDRVNDLLTQIRLDKIRA